MKRFLLIVLFLPSIVAAQTTDTFYVNAGCANNGNGTTNACAASNGAAGAFNDLETAVESQATDLVAANKIYVFEVEGSSSDSIGAITTDAYTADSTRYVHIRCSGAYRTTGVWDTGRPRMSCSDYYGCIEANDTIHVTGCQWESIRQTDGVGAFVYVRSPVANTRVHLEGNLARYNCASSCMGSRGVQVDNAGGVNGVTVRLVNNIIYNFGDYGLYWDMFAGTGWTLLLYNNTFADNTDGQINITADAASDTLHMKGNIMQGADTGNNWSLSSAFTTTTTAKNITEDASSPNGASWQNKVVTFSNEASDDFRLGSGDTVAKDAGDDLSADGTYAFSTDIDGSTRSGSWDIGADEVSAGGGGLPPAVLCGEN